jgi:hypothetical protein
MATSRNRSSVGLQLDFRLFRDASRNFVVSPDQNGSSRKIALIDNLDPIVTNRLDFRVDQAYDCASVEPINLSGPGFALLTLISLGLVVVSQEIDQASAGKGFDPGRSAGCCYNPVGSFEPAYAL